MNKNRMTMRSFASDNNSGVHPLVMEALNRANSDHAVGYGDDPWTEEAVCKIREALRRIVNRCSYSTVRAVMRWLCSCVPALIIPLFVQRLHISMSMSAVRLPV